jgi:multiple sugar transport system ATP-binding protein
VTPEEGGLPVDVLVVEELGAESYLYGTSDVEGTPAEIVVRLPARGAVEKGTTVHVTTDPRNVHVFDTDTGARLSD